MRHDQHDDSQATVGDDLVLMLDLLAATIAEALRFGVACINIARADGTLEVVSVAGDEDARKKLLGTVQTAEAWDTLLSVSEPWGRLRFADHRSAAAEVDILRWVPDIVTTDAEDAWHPEDALFAPLTAGDGSRLGTLSVDLPRDGRRPDAPTCRALEAFAISAALAIEHAALRSRAETSELLYRRLASHDALTGVGNRSMLLERLGHAVTRRPEAGTSVAVIFVDLDKFKTVNDLRSHDAGDHVLKAVAHRIQAVVRPHDTVVRWGGDEFLVLLEHIDDESAALAVARRVAAAVAEPVEHLGDELSVSASLGVAMSRAGEQIDANELITRADAAMYASKRLGGNACTVFPPAPDTDLSNQQ